MAEIGAVDQARTPTLQLFSLRGKTVIATGGKSIAATHNAETA